MRDMLGIKAQRRNNPRTYLRNYSFAWCNESLKRLTNSANSGRSTRLCI
jgi:hypothetical protein